MTDIFWISCIKTPWNDREYITLRFIQVTAPLFRQSKGNLSHQFRKLSDLVFIWHCTDNRMMNFLSFFSPYEWSDLDINCFFLHECIASLIFWHRLSGHSALSFPPRACSHFQYDWFKIFTLHFWQLRKYLSKCMSKNNYKKL